MSLQRSLSGLVVLMILGGCTKDSAQYQSESSTAISNPPVVTQFRAHFHTLDDDKDKGDGITESYVLEPNIIMGRGQSYARDTVFKEDSHSEGEKYDVAKFGVTVDKLDRVRYTFDMDTNHAWNVMITIYAEAGGFEYRVAQQTCSIGSRGAYNGPRTGSIQLSSISTQAQMMAARTGPATIPASSPVQVPVPTPSK